MDSARTPSGLLPEWFEQQATATPDAVAVTTADTTVTYGELNARANRLARHLVALGAGPEQLVAVGMRRSAELIVVLLAVLKAGAAYLPVDLDSPPQRTALLMRDARPALLVTVTADRSLVQDPQTPAVVLDEPDTAARVADRACDDLADPDRRAPLRPAHPAYVIYTSGSTGTPKGVVVEHRALAAYLAFASGTYPAVSGQAVLHSSVAFDMTVTTLFAPLARGGCVRVSALEAVPRRPDFLKVTPSHLALMATLAETVAPSRDLVVGGELLLGEVLRTFRRDHPEVTVINEYGPTEATVGCCVHVLRPGDPVAPGPVPIGRPTWATRLYLLDDRLEPVAPGDEGELYIGGEQLARGYLRRPALTADRFLPDPFGPPGWRMYRTGDRVRQSPDGNLVYLGRLDRQVKIRGYRVELGEIESVLLRHRDVGQVAVSVRGQHVVAYVVPAAGRRCDQRQLREHAAASLPEYMVPGAFVTLDALPLNDNGKLDARELPAPRFDSAAPFRAPVTPEQKMLCDLFARYADAQVLVGVHDDFFALGGSSLSAAQVVNEARRAGLALTVRDLLTNRTVAGLTGALVGEEMGT